MTPGPSSPLSSTTGSPFDPATPSPPFGCRGPDRAGPRRADGGCPGYGHLGRAEPLFHEGSDPHHVPAPGVGDGGADRPLLHHGVRRGRRPLYVSAQVAEWMEAAAKHRAVPA